MLRISIEFDGSKFDRVFTRYTEQVSDLRQVWPGVITELRAAMREQFAGQGVGPSGSWAQLSPRYRAWKEKQFPGLPILQRSKRLVQSLTGNTSDTVLIAAPDSLTFGTRRPGAVYHQSTRGRKKLPRRAVFDLNEPQKIRITKAIQRRLLTTPQQGVSLR